MLVFYKQEVQEEPSSMTHSQVLSFQDSDALSNEVQELAASSVCFSRYLKISHCSGKVISTAWTN